jgi:hypothetical protein
MRASQYMDQGQGQGYGRQRGQSSAMRMVNPRSTQTPNIGQVAQSMYRNPMSGQYMGSHTPLGRRHSGSMRRVT